MLGLSDGPVCRPSAWWIIPITVGLLAVSVLSLVASVFGRGDGDPTVGLVVGFAIALLAVGFFANQMFCWRLEIVDGDLVWRSLFGLKVERIPIGTITKITSHRRHTLSGFTGPILEVRAADRVTMTLATGWLDVRSLARVIGELRRANNHIKIGHLPGELTLPNLE